jgi:hypothetical protein
MRRTLISAGYCPVFILLLTVCPVSAYAEDYKVDTPRIGDVGGVSPEVDYTYSAAHDKDKNAYFSQIYGVNYAVTNYWETSFFAEIEKQPSVTMVLSNVKWENTFAPFKPGENWIDVGFFIGFEKAVDDDLHDNLETKLLLEKDIGRFANKANIILNYNFGPHDIRGLDGGLAWITTYKINDEFQPGIEYYTDISRLDHAPEFNRQSHVVGPVMQGEIKEFSYDAGVLFGISDGAPDVTFKFDLWYDF